MRLILTILIGTAGLAAQATEYSAAERKCGTGVYCADEMVCIGRVQGEPPKGMAPDFLVKVLYLKAFKTAKRLPDGTRTLVDSLQIDVEPAGDTPDITLPEAWAKADFTYGNYGAPAIVAKKKVHTDWASGDSRGLRLQIRKSSNRDTYRWDELTGSEDVQGDVVADYSIRYECEAKVVESPTRVDDFTKKP